MQVDFRVQSLGQKDPLKEGRATHFSILVWRVPWTEKPGRLQSLGSQRVRHNWSNLVCCTIIATKRIKHLGGDLTKEVQDLFRANCKTSLTESKEDINKQKDILCSQSENSKLLRWQYSPNRFTDWVENPSTAEIDTDPKILWQCQGPRAVKRIMEKKNKLERLRFPNFKILQSHGNQDSVCRYKNRNRNQQNRIEK